MDEGIDDIFGDHQNDDMDDIMDAVEEEENSVTNISWLLNPLYAFEAPTVKNN